MMKLYKHITVFILIAFIAMVFSCSEDKNLKEVTIPKDAFKINAPAEQAVTKNGIKIEFQTFDATTFPLLDFVISGTYGTTVLKAKLEEKLLFINIPKEFSKHAGILEWELIANSKTLEKGSFQLLPDTEKLQTIENYVGPRSIVSNDRDYTMLVSIPVDSLDNLLTDQTSLQINQQFKGNITTTTKEIKSGIAWQRIAAPLVTGRLITGSTMEQISSKELIVDIFPDIATTFIITKDSNHNYADGNEIITLKTDQIKDQYGNIMTDGTLITFFIKDNHDQRWQTTASTINGYAFAKALHPQKPSTWTVKGVINGMVESPELDIKFESIIDEIPFSFDEKNTLIVGPLTSYLGQLVPDGIAVNLKLNNKDVIVRTKNGIATYTYDTKIIAPATYDIEITTLGITTVKSIKLR